ncbi:zinc finger CCHC domain-containing protein 7 isoform X1 [Poecilia reticulata]|uniref:Zinc finger CCHC domain-containing protein 7 n=1 Tax=Poecilia reticulata TaxID=8081 RepID=A0A3P9NJP1_POERE|nr:PREDICTED: zinc finger CCHC domain-containing protein 7 isoform X1 [Poecilia reticulata]XP_008410683.1 PREDICTED: zinc finger CCHC domain-containing protein 7 isoform X1 [Poecilia reticulata]
MYSAYQDREELEDNLYQEDGDSDESEANSELEFHLYSQLHYSSNAGELDELEPGAEEENNRQESQQGGVLEKTTDKDPELRCTKQSNPTSSADDHLKTKKDAKKKKGKIEPKSPKLSSSRFEEVIVIDSSPDVISISDNNSDDEDDASVCTQKAKGSQMLQTSTPAQQVEETNSQKRKGSLFVPVAVLSSSSESSESESESEPLDSSDVDDLENWMILGQARQDGDQSISLNVEGGSCSSSSTDADEEDEKEEGSWIVSEKDKEAQIFNKGQGPTIVVHRMSNRYYTGKNVHCRNCNKKGHLSKNCPHPKKVTPCFLCGSMGHQAITCPNKHCNNCGQPGHLSRCCSERSYWHKQCHRCSMRGHFFDDCPEIWRQYHITTKKGPPVKQPGGDSDQPAAYCYNCSKKGHLGYECTKRRMFSGVFPSYPFICHYDTVKDINRRLHRMKIKANDMGRIGNLSSGSPALPTPGPQRKKQKINHQNASPDPKNTSHQNPNSYRPSPNHIIFNVDDFNDDTPKTKMAKQPKSGGSAKPWKPKRAVPTTRDPVPLSKLVIDEADDFPRGGGPQGNQEEKMRKKKKGCRTKQVNSSIADHVFRTGGEQSQDSKSSKKNQTGEKKRQKGRSNKTAKKQLHGATYSEEDNLFLIKQRKRSR